MKAKTNKLLTSAVKEYHKIVCHPNCDRGMMLQARKYFLSIVVSLYVDNEITYDIFYDMIEDIKRTESDFRFIEKYGFKGYQQTKLDKIMQG